MKDIKIESTYPLIVSNVTKINKTVIKIHLYNEQFNSNLSKLMLPTDKYFIIFNDIALIKDKELKQREIDKINLLPNLFIALNCRTSPYYVHDHKGERKLYGNNHLYAGKPIITNIIRLTCTIDDDKRSIALHATDFIDYFKYNE